MDWATLAAPGIRVLSPWGGDTWEPDLDPLVLLWWFAFWNMARGRLAGVGVVLR